MRNTKKIILISIIILAILIIAGVFAYIYFFTDTFLSTQERFYKYISKNSEIIDFFEDEDLEKYFEKQKTESYSNNGEITVGVSGDFDEETQAVIDELSKIKITFSGDIDNSSQYFYQSIGLNRDETEIIGATFIQEDDYYGFLVNDIIKVFITLENNNLKEFAKNLGFTDEQVELIPDKIEKNEVNEEIFTDEEWNQLKEKYWQAISSNLSEDMFSESESEEYKIYTLKIDEEKAAKICTSILEAVENDELIENKIKEVYKDQVNTEVTDEEIQEVIDSYKSYIEELKNDINYDDTSTEQDEESTSDNTLYINVYVSNRKLVKTEIKVSEEGSIELALDSNKATFKLIDSSDEETKTSSLSIEKTKTDSELKYNLKIQPDESSQDVLEVTAAYTGLSEMSNVQENYIINLSLVGLLSNDTENVYTVDSDGNLTNTEIANTANDSNSENEEDITDISLNCKNVITFGDIEKQELNKNNLYIINNKTLEQLANMFSQLSEKITIKIESAYEDIVSEEEDSYQNTINSTDLTDTEMATFNSNFTSYEGTTVTSSQVNALIQSVISSNTTQKSSGGNRYVSIKFPSVNGTTMMIDETTTSTENSKVTTGVTYTVSIEYEDGYVKTITVTAN